MATERADFAIAIETNAPDFGLELSDDQIALLADYYELLLKWNERLHLVAPCSPEEFGIRHVLESLVLLPHFSPRATVVDVGSGGGLPIIPCLLIREDLHATLVESSKRKTVFLREALRLVASPERAAVVNARFEELDFPASDFLTCRALDRFSQLLPRLIERVGPQTTLLLFAGDALGRQVQSLIPSARLERVPHSEKRFLVIAGQNPNFSRF
ncbi:MAG TPA: 16S rRNA (guanine(527)-N(7))-methyltransferase RsmG [Pyrinomonadaceae bacterium]|jgi:16S rRNA (guanine527-N7)-methyltransferase|nr:16S rRNA (guanine(527)-N(7))-methyltransferase RsmG [Pyrinomonadaceae bacterium]